jgi:hypothetical protein
VAGARGVLWGLSLNVWVSCGYMVRYTTVNGHIFGLAARNQGQAAVC